MGRKKKEPVDNKKLNNPDWEISDTIKVNGRIVEAGTELSIRGVRGRFKFLSHIKTPTTEWVDVVGGMAGYKHFRSFRPDQIKTVHYKKRLRDNQKTKTTHE